MNTGLRVKWAALFPWAVMSAIFTAMVGGVLLASLSLNHGFFAYTVDDIYIVLELSKNISMGHYGVNAVEPAAAASSYLWPYILAIMPDYIPFAFILNYIFSLGVLGVVTKIGLDILASLTLKYRLFWVTVLGSLICLATNMVGLVFVGLEHSLHLLVVTLCVWGSLRLARGASMPYLSLIALIVGPFVRLEQLALSVVMVLLLVYRRYWGQVAISIVAIGLLFGICAYSMHQQGLPVIPASIQVKSVAYQDGVVVKYVMHLKCLLESKESLFFFAGMLPLVVFLIVGKSSAYRMVALAAVLVGLGHLFLGGVGANNRYTPYVWLYFILINCVVFEVMIQHGLQRLSGWADHCRLALASAIVLVPLSSLFVYGLSQLPFASNNIVSQHYQMHRFVAQYYLKPVAVNDIGYVAFRNPHYVLDLWGLSSVDSLKLRIQNPGTSEWVAPLAAQKQVELVMIYEDWFPHLPSSLIKIGDLELIGVRRVSPAGSKVAFFATNSVAAAEIRQKLMKFEPTLPSTARFVWASDAL